MQEQNTRHDTQIKIKNNKKHTHTKQPFPHREMLSNSPFLSLAHTSWPNASPQSSTQYSKREKQKTLNDRQATSIKPNKTAQYSTEKNIYIYTALNVDFTVSQLYISVS